MISTDLLVVGGGINGVGIARDAAGRGLHVTLCEMNDLASATSSSSTKLIHGGLRYLERYEFRLVRESLIEREVLLNVAPHLIKPMRFILPHHEGLRPYWLLRLGLFLYDHIGGRQMLPSARSVDLVSSLYGQSLRGEFTRGFEYTDCRADDSRLVVLNAMDAAERGARIFLRTRFHSAKREGNSWRCALSTASGQNLEVKAKAIVNAAGPWVTGLLDGIEKIASRKRLRLVKGSHIITRKLFDHDRAYIFQNSDGRIIFAIPYINNTTLVGTTEEPYQGDPADASISDEEKNYLCRSASGYFKRTITPDQIISDFSGVRPLYDEIGNKSASAVTRDYAFDVDRKNSGASFLSIYGGKLTTYRKLAEHALSQLSSDFPNMGVAWTKSAHLPGGEMGYAGWQEFIRETQEQYRFISSEVLQRMMSAYGSRIHKVLYGVKSLDDLGVYFGAGLYAKELDYLCNHEWAKTAEDVLLRRTKLGLFLSEERKERIGFYFDEKKCNTAK